MEDAHRRLTALASHITCNNNSLPREKHDNDVVIVSVVRTVVCKSNRGAFKDTPPEMLLAAVLEAVVAKVGVHKSHVDDIVVGNVRKQNSAMMARIAMLVAGFSHATPVMTVNRACSSGLQAIANVANAVAAGEMRMGIAAALALPKQVIYRNSGLYCVESMSLSPSWKDAVGPPPPSVQSNTLARDCLIPMGITAEIVAERFGVSRETQDSCAALSHEKALKAQKAGLFEAEIIPVKTTVKNEKTGELTEVIVTKDDGIRAGTTVEALAKLKPAFQGTGTVTAGNSSQISDGAAAALITTRKVAKELNLKILGRFLSYEVVGVPPSIMGVGPVYAVPKAVLKAGLSMDDIDIFEVNEAFASQLCYCAERLKIPPHKLNPNGGAIALGHPVGCTGVRQVATLLHQLRRENKKFGVVSMCVGSGMGAAAVFEAE